MNGDPTAAHLELLDAAGITPEVARAAGVRSVTKVDELPEVHRWCRQVPGLVFPWRSPSGGVVEQYRPDTAVKVDDVPRRYLWPKGAGLVLNVHPAHVDRLATARLLVLVEGTKQTLAAVPAAGSDVAVIGIAGCYGWSSDGAPIADIALIQWERREVVAVFDADVATNPDVHEAAQRLAQELDLRGAERVRFAELPGGGKQGLDDVLASRRVNGSAAGPFAKLLEGAGRLPKKPVRRGAFMGSDGLMVAKLVEAVRDRHHLAVDPGDRLLVYVDGVYVDGRHVVTATIGDLLGDAYRPLHNRAAIELLIARLVADGLVIGDSPDSPLVNVANGLLDPFTGTLTPHTPEHLSLVRFPIHWNPNATVRGSTPGSTRSPTAAATTCSKRRRSCWTCAANGNEKPYSRTARHGPRNRPVSASSKPSSVPTPDQRLGAPDGHAMPSAPGMRSAAAGRCDTEAVAAPRLNHRIRGGLDVPARRKFANTQQKETVQWPTTPHSPASDAAN